MNFQGLTVLVTGGARGIGRELAISLVAKGAVVIIVGRSRDQLDAMVSEYGASVTAMAADLADPGDVDRVIASLIADKVPLAGLFNNAASQTEMDLFGGNTTSPRAVSRAEIGLNLDAAISLTIGLLPVLRAQPRAIIINTTTGLAIAPKEASPVYCATKAGLRSFTKALRYQCQTGAPNIVVHEAIMALVDTGMTAGRGSGKISAASAAAAILHGIEDGDDEIWVGKTKLLRVVNRISPSLAARIIR